MNSPERNKPDIAFVIHWKHLLIICFFLIFLIPSDDPSAQMRSYFQKRHFLYGSFEFDYEQQWGERVSEIREFTQNYNLGFRSFLIDPRLVNYNTSLTFTREKGNEKTSSLTGLDFNINILETPPRQWSGFRRYIPGPLMLRYSSYANDYDYKSYGIGLIYSIPEEQQRTQSKDKKDKKEKDFIIPLPIVYFDYDKTEYSTSNYKNISDLYSLRATLRRNYYDYEFTYENFAQTGTLESQRTTYTLSPDYTFYDKETKRRIDINNHIKMEDTDTTKQFFLSSNITMHKPINKNLLYLNGRVVYSNLTSNQERAASYSSALGGSYTKVFSPILKNTASLSLSHGASKSSTRHSVRLSDSVLYEISKLLTSSSGVFIGKNENGLEYGLQTQLSTKTKIRSAAGYSYSFLSYEDGDKSTHTFNLLASGPLKENVTFNASTSYTMQDVTEITGPYSENISSSSANLFWRVANTSLSLGGNYVNSSKMDEQTINSDLLSFNGNLSRAMAKNIFFNLFSTWIKEPDDKTTFEINPKILWTLRQVSVDAEYKYTGITALGIAIKKEHRIFIKLTRRFYRLL